MIQTRVQNQVGSLEASPRLWGHLKKILETMAFPSKIFAVYEFGTQEKVGTQEKSRYTV